MHILSLLLLLCLQIDRALNTRAINKLTAEQVEQASQIPIQYVTLSNINISDSEHLGPNIQIINY